MTERDFPRLKDLPVPAPRAGAKRAALDAALAAFEQQQSEQSNTQGDGGPARLNDASSQMERRLPMRRTFKFNYALAASVAALMVAAPAAFHVLKKSHDLAKDPTSNLSDKLSKPAELSGV